MSENGNIGNPFSTDAIRLYLEGKLSVEQMHALEKAAMEDPFLADAIEGMQIRMLNKEGSFEGDIQDLQLKLHERTHKGVKENKIIPLLMSWRGAAAIILLGGSIFLSYRFLFQDKSTLKPIAKVEKKETVPAEAKSADSIVQTRPETTTTAGDKTSAIPTEKPKSQKPGEKKTKPALKKNDNSDFAKDDLKKSTDQTSIEKEDDRQVLSEKPIAGKEPISPAPTEKTEAALESRASGVAVQPSVNTGNFVFRGRVVDQRRRPVVGASVGFKNKKAVAVTDEQGRFRIKTNNSDTNAIVVINSVGYQPALHMLSSDSADNLVQLTLSSSSLNEVVVAGYGSKKNADSADEYVYDVLPGKHTIRIEKAVPANGWTEYNRYLSKNKKISTADSVLSGEEMISFLVDSNGRLSEFQIVRSISPSHDDEAIRLLRQGPAWKLLKGKKQRTTITIKF